MTVRVGHAARSFPSREDSRVAVGNDIRTCDLKAINHIGGNLAKVIIGIWLWNHVAPHYLVIRIYPKQSFASWVNFIQEYVRDHAKFFSTTKNEKSLNNSAQLVALDSVSVRLVAPTGRPPRNGYTASVETCELSEVEHFERVHAK
jgi:hypothetical protein